jgi:hypothetical protein
VVLEYIAPVSSLMIAILFYIDSATTRETKSKHVEKAGALLFSSYRRTVLVYMLGLLGLVLYPVLIALPYLFSQPPVLIFCLSLAGFLVGLPTLAAKTREKRLAKVSQDPMQYYRSPTDSLCFQKLVELLGSSTESGFFSSEELTAFLERRDLVEVIIKILIEHNFNEDCVDEILWKTYFDRFEHNASGILRRRALSKKAFSNYIRNRETLLEKHDSSAQVFKGSLSRWHDSHGL